MEIQIRSFEGRDRSFILSLVPRLIERTRLPHRLPIEVIASLERPLCDFMADFRADLRNDSGGVPGTEAKKAPASEAILIAETPDGTGLGFIYLQTKTDAFTLEPQAHLADIVVTATAEGQGVGTALMAQAEIWARHHQCRLLTLNAFAGNEAVRLWYERQGFEAETVQYLKRLD